MDTFFDVAGKNLAELSGLTRLQSRGTIRIICSDAGHDKPEKVSKPELIELLQERLAQELKKRGVEDPEGVVEGVVESIKKAPEFDRAYDAFSRI